VDVNGELIVCRKPKDAAFQQFTDKILGDKSSKASAAKSFVLGCVVHPDREAAKELLAEYPALISSLSAALQDLAGGDLEVTVSKS
jgi:hypothetical protein